MFKNLTVFSSPVGWVPDVDKLKETLSVPNEVGSRWAAVRDREPLLNIHNQILLSIETQKKVIPASVVKKEMDLRIKKFIEETGDTLMPKSRIFLRNMKETVLEALWAKAFVTSSFTRIWINPAEGLLCLDTTSNSRVDDAIQLMIRSGFDGLKKPETSLSPFGFMRNMLIDDSYGGSFTVDRCCEIEEEGGGSIKYKNEPLDTEEVRKHLMQGKAVTRLAMTYNNSISFQLHGDFSLSKLQILDINNKKMAAGSEEEPLENDFFLMAGEYSGLIEELIVRHGEAQ